MSLSCNEVLTPFFMTTKNWEFDLQLFALDANPTIRASSGAISVNGGVDDSGTPTTVTGDTVDVDGVIYRTDTVTSSATVYAFSSGEASVPANAAVITKGENKSVTAYGYASVGTAEEASIGSTTPELTFAENVSVSSPLWLTGGGEADTFLVRYTNNDSLLDTVAVSNAASLGMTASNNAVNYSSLRGAVQATLAAPAQFRQTLNGASINVSLSSNAVTLTGSTDSNDAVTIQAAGNAALSSVDANQIWNVSNGNNVVFGALSAAAVGESFTATKGAGNYLALNVENGAGVEFSSSGSSPRDTVDVNGVILNGVATTQAEVYPVDSTLMTAHANNAGVFSVGDGASGGAVALASGSTASVVSQSTDSSVIKAVDALAANGRWTVASSAGAVQLGNDTVAFDSVQGTITAGATGAQAALFNPESGNVTINAVGDHDALGIISGSSWDVDLEDDSAATINAVLDASGNITVNSGTGAGTMLLSGGQARTVVGAAGDTLAVSSGQSVSLNSSALVTAASALNEGSNWLVKGGSGARTVNVGGVTATFARATDSVYAILTASSVNGASVSAVSSLTGNMTISAPSSATLSGVEVMGTAWTVSGASVGAVVMDSTGAGVSLGAGDSLKVMAADATVTVAGEANTISGSFNGASVVAHDSNNEIVVQLDSDVSVAGLAGITSLNSGATVSGDSHFTINDKFDVSKLTNTVSAVDFTLGGSSSITVNDVVDGDAYSVTGGTVYYDIDSTVSSGGTAKVTVNAAEVTLGASSSSNLDSAYIVSGENDAIVSVGGLKVGDTVKTASDSVFAAGFTYDSAMAASTDTVAMAINDVGVTMNGGSDGVLDSTASAIQMYVSKSGSAKPNVTITGGIAKNSTITVGAGVYSVGSSATVEVNDSIGYLYVDSIGNVTAEDSVVAQIRIDRDSLVNQLASSLNGGNTTVEAFHDFYNIYNETTQAFDGTYGTVAGYASATVDSPETVAQGTGVNIYGDEPLGAADGTFPRNITLQSYISNPINVEYLEGLRTGVSTIRTAVIDATGSPNTLIAVGMNTDSDIAAFATNHTILGSTSARNVSILIGPKATGNNYVKAGDNGSYIYNRGGAATILGGSGSDTIYGSGSDYIEGGAGIDYFYDTNAFEIADYSFDDRDVIVATKLSTSARLTPDNVQLDGNKIAIANGSTITVGGSDYDPATATKAIITNANVGDRKNLIWAGNYGSLLDASEITINGGALMISSINGGAENTVVGSSLNDTIVAGPNDTINPGAGTDTVSLASADSGSGQRGATITLTSGKTDVYGWKSGFDADSGANVLLADSIDSLSFKLRDAVVASSGNASINFNGLSTVDGAYRFLVNGTPVSFIAPDATATVSTNADLSAYYKGEKAGGIYVTDSVTTAFEVTLGSAKLSNITKLNVASEARATVWGSSANESITVSGSADAGSRKYVAVGGGNDVLVSGGNDTTKSGNNFYFGSSNGVTYSSGRTTITGFNFYKGQDQDVNVSSADLLYLGDRDNYKGVSATSTRLEVSLSGDETVVISGDFTTSDHKAVRAQFANDSKIYNIKFGVSNSVNTFTYDGETDIYYGGVSNSRPRDVLNVSSDTSNVNIWLNDSRLDSVSYGGIGMVNASSVQNGNLTLAGGASNNTILSGGSNTSTSLWGGGGETNSLVGSNGGEETFFFFKSYGYTTSEGVYRSSTDTITTVGTEDLVWLYDVTLDDIDNDKTAISSGRIDVVLKDGGGVVVTGVGTETNFRLSDGNGGWQNIKSVNTGNRHWE